MYLLTSSKSYLSITCNRILIKSLGVIKAQVQNNQDNTASRISVSFNIASISFLAAFLILFSTSNAFAQTGVVTGTITSAESGKPLPGANVIIEGTSLGAAADQDGEYRVTVPAGEQTVIVTFLGFQESRATVTVRAGETTTQNFQLESEAFTGEEILVTGLRRGQVRSVNHKREAMNIVDAISADEVGKLPDLNVAESTQRIPGITIRTDRGEGRFVSIRGTSPNRNNVTFNGQTMASSAGSRATALDLVPSEMVSNIEVAKAVTPDMDANALGGSVNISTLTAFDREGSFLSASLNGMRHQKTTDFGETRLPFRSSVTTGTRFGGNDEWGLVLSGTASRRDFKTAMAHPDDWRSVDGFVGPAEFEMEVEDNDRVRYSANANLDYRPTERTSAYLRLHHSRRDEHFANTEVILDGGGIEPTSATTGQVIFESELDIPITDIDEKLYALTLGAEQQLGEGVKWDIRGTYSRGERDRRTHQPEWGFDQDFMYSYDISGEHPVYQLADPDAVFDPANYEFDEMDIEFETLRENTWQVSTDLQWDLQLGEGTGFLKAGAQSRFRDKDIDENEDPWAAGDDKFTLADFGFYQEPPGPFRDGAIGGNPRLPVTGNTRAFLDFWEQNNDTDRYFFLDPVESNEEEVERDAEVTEAVHAGYIMGNVRIGALTATGGLRVEATRTTSNRFRFIIDDEFDEALITQESSSNSYIDFLPSLHLVYHLSDDMQLRGAWSNTIGRPDYLELSAFQDFEFEESETGVWEANIEEGNPDLLPYRAMNFDVSAEYYWGPGGLVSPGAFYKRINNPIYEFAVTERDVFGRDVAVDIQNIPGFNDRFFQEVNYEQLRNADAGNILGLEASFMEIFDFLPGLLNGLGIVSNVAIMDSDVTVPDREDENLPFFDQSDIVYNVAPYYQYGNLELRAAFNYQGDYLNSVSSEAFEDSYGGLRRTIDLSGRYEFMEGRLQLNTYLRNLTNEAERSYQGRRSRISSHALTGRTFELGLSLRL